MVRTCFILVAGLDENLLKNHTDFPLFSSLPYRSAYAPVVPAVTSPMQATLTTGVVPMEHGIISNGLYTFADPSLHRHLDLTNHAEARTSVSFWEQSNSLLQRARFWHNSGKKVAMLFWQNSIGAADIVLTPKPTHTPDGKTISACFSAPADLYPTLVEKFGPFPLHHYWSPMAGLPSSQWIVKAAEFVWDTHTPDLQLVYIPHLDYNLQRLGPTHPQIGKDISDVAALLERFADKIRSAGDNLVIAGDYGMNAVDTPLFPNLLLREAKLLEAKPDAAGKLLIDHGNSKAFVLADHQVGHLFVAADYAERVLDILRSMNAELCSSPANSRAGQYQLLAPRNAWFAHDYWLSDDEKPAWQFSVDIHNKPGYDPRELFFDAKNKCITQDARLVKGSHGLVSPSPVVLSNVALPAQGFDAVALGRWLASVGMQRR